MHASPSLPFPTPFPTSSQPREHSCFAQVTMDIRNIDSCVSRHNRQTTRCSIARPMKSSFSKERRWAKFFSFSFSFFLFFFAFLDPSKGRKTFYARSKDVWIFYIVRYHSNHTRYFIKNWRYFQRVLNVNDIDTEWEWSVNEKPQIVRLGWKISLVVVWLQSGSRKKKPNKMEMRLDRSRSTGKGG